MMTKDEALRMAIEVFDMYGNKMNSAFADEAYQACKEALAQPTAEQSSLVQEPVAYQPTSQEQSVMHQAMIRSSKLVHKATPPSREWQSLSDDEILRLEGLDCVDEEYIKRFVRAIEQELKGKNT